MVYVAEFLFAENMLDEFGFLRYVYHTQKPRALVEVEFDGETDKFKVIDEIDSFDMFPKEDVEVMMARLKEFWFEYKREILEEVDNQPDNVDVKTPDLDDAVTFSIINGTDKPDPTEFALMRKNSLVKMSINGIEFWASVIEFDLQTETIYGIVQSYLDEKSLKTRDSFMAQFCNVWAIENV